MTKVFYEKIDVNKLIQVLECDNIPFKTNKKIETDNVKEQLKNYASLPMNENGEFSVVYSKESETSLGRYYCKNGVGLQMLKKEIRLFLCDNKYMDVDIINCHPVLLEQMLKKEDIQCKMLSEYNKNREKFIKKYKIKNKESLLIVINDIQLRNKQFKEIHESIYGKNGLFEKLKKNHKQIYDLHKHKCVKNNTSKNIEGSFFSLMIQEEENTILEAMIDYLHENDIEVNVPVFDGFMLYKNENVNETLLRSLEKIVKNKTGFEIQLKFKSTEVQWSPNKIESIDKKDFDLIKGFQFDARKLKNFEWGVDYKLDCSMVDYLNKFIIQVDTVPMSYLTRRNTEVEFNHEHLRKECDASSFIGKRHFTKWIEHENKAFYSDIGFIVNEDEEKQKTKNGEFLNLYVRPKYIIPEEKSLKKLSPLIWEYFENCLCDKDEVSIDFLCKVFAKILNEGRSGIVIVIRGESGDGKSTLIECCLNLVANGDKKYYYPISDINEINNKFNSQLGHTIIIACEEAVNDASHFNQAQSSIKHIATSDYLKVESKGFNAKNQRNNNNIFITTNHWNPVRVDGSDRRMFCLETSGYRNKDYDFFIGVQKEFLREDVRGFFKSYKYNKDLGPHIPSTKIKRDMIEACRQSWEIFIEEFLDYVIEDCVYKTNKGDILEDENTYDLRTIYNQYIQFCEDKNISKHIEQSALSIKLNKSFVKTFQKTVREDGKKRQITLKRGYLGRPRQI